MKNEPLISVIIPFYNAELYIYESILSIINQDYFNLEILLVNDGSSDSSVDIIRKINDPRIKLYNNEKNQGIVYSLNLAISKAKGEFIARMDADDVAYRNRFSTQLTYLMNNPNVDLIGSYYKIMNRGFFYKLPLKHKDILNHMLISSPIAHPTVFFRRALIDNGDYYYRNDYQYCEDFDLWSRLVFKYNLANLPDFLLEYRSHENQISKTKNEVQKNKTIEVRTNMLKVLSSDLNRDFLFFINNEIYYKLFENRFRKNFKALDELLNSNNQKVIYEATFFSNYINDLQRSLITKTLYNSNINNILILFFFILRNTEVLKFITIGTFLKLCFQNIFLYNLYRR